MYQIENFELNTSRVVAFQPRAGGVIRVTAGRLWITVQGQSDDVWLQAGQRWTVPQGHVVAWLSAEPAASFQMAHAIAPQRRWGLVQLLLVFSGLGRWWRSPAPEGLRVG